MNSSRLPSTSIDQFEFSLFFRVLNPSQDDFLFFSFPFALVSARRSPYADRSEPRRQSCVPFDRFSTESVKGYAREKSTRVLTFPRLPLVLPQISFLPSSQVLKANYYKQCHQRNVTVRDIFVTVHFKIPFGPEDTGKPTVSPNTVQPGRPRERPKLREVILQLNLQGSQASLSDSPSLPRYCSTQSKPCPRFYIYIKLVDFQIQYIKTSILVR
jgi:hypothetical protein